MKVRRHRRTANSSPKSSRLPSLRLFFCRRYCGYCYHYYCYSLYYRYYYYYYCRRDLDSSSLHPSFCFRIQSLARRQRLPSTSVCSLSQPSQPLSTRIRSSKLSSPRTLQPRSRRQTPKSSLDLSYPRTRSFSSTRTPCTPQTVSRTPLYASTVLVFSSTVSGQRGRTPPSSRS